MRTLLAALGVFAALAGGMSAAAADDGADDDTGQAATASTTATVTITIADRVQPASVTVAPGTMVVWHNADTARHRIRTTSAPVQLDSGNLEPGERWGTTLQVPGTYRYHDDRREGDPAYQGEIVVSAGDRSRATDSGASVSGDAPAGATTEPAPATDQVPATVAVRILDRSFSPARIRVAVGGRVDWTNVSDRDHTVTFQDRSTPSSQVLGPGGTFSATFTRAGTFAYLCAIHPDMVGTVEVVGASAGEAASPGGTGSDPVGEPAADAAPPPAEAPPVSGAGAAPPAPTTVDVRDFLFAPAELTVGPGTRVVWRNLGDLPHTVTAEDGSFDSGLLAPGATFTVTIDGPVRYLCTLHPQMRGIIVVRGATDRPALAAEPGAAGTDPLTTSDAGADRRESTTADRETTGAVPLTVEQAAGEGGGGGPALVAVAALVVALGSLGWWWARRRERTPLP